MDAGNGCSAVGQEKTSDFYETHNLPARFEYPGPRLMCAIIVFPQHPNTAFLSNVYESQWLNGLQNYSKTRRTPTNPFYATTYNDYGYFPPTVHTVRKCYHGKPQRIGQEQFVRGMYRDNSLNM